MNEVPRLTGLRIATDWRRAVAVLGGQPAVEDMASVLDTKRVFSSAVPVPLEAQPLEIRDMLRGLAQVFEEFYETHDVVSVLGV